MGNASFSVAEQIKAVKQWFPSPVWIIIVSLTIGAFSFYTLYDGLMDDEYGDDICDDYAGSPLECLTFKTTTFGNGSLSMAAEFVFISLLTFSAIYIVAFLVSMGITTSLANARRQH